jgi:hypothetical protein
MGVPCRRELEFVDTPPVRQPCSGCKIVTDNVIKPSNGSDKDLRQRTGTRRSLKATNSDVAPRSDNRCKRISALEVLRSFFWKSLISLSRRKVASRLFPRYVALIPRLATTLPGISKNETQIPERGPVGFGPVPTQPCSPKKRKRGSRTFKSPG